jgi:tetratricopeptide (TPR) repeat protein
MAERLQMPPLSNQENSARRLGALKARMDQLARQMNGEHAAGTRRGFQKLVEQRPEDYFLHQEYGVFLELNDDFAGAAAEWQHYRDLVPQDSLGYYQLGRMLNAQHRFAEAEASLRVATAIRPNRTDVWAELGGTLALQGKYAEALVCYSTALQQEPRNAQTLVGRGRVLARLGRHAEAMASYRAAIGLNPADGFSHHELGVELLATEQPGAGGNELAEAARLSPDNVSTRFDFGTWLMTQSRWDEAQREFEAVVHLEPANLPARQNLAWLQAGRPQRPSKKTQ